MVRRRVIKDQDDTVDSDSNFADYVPSSSMSLILNSSCAVSNPEIKSMEGKENLYDENRILLRNTDARSTVTNNGLFGCKRRGRAIALQEMTNMASNLEFSFQELSKSGDIQSNGTSGKKARKRLSCVKNDKFPSQLTMSDCDSTMLCTNSQPQTLTPSCSATLNLGSSVPGPIDLRYNDVHFAYNGNHSIDSESDGNLSDQSEVDESGGMHFISNMVHISSEDNSSNPHSLVDYIDEGDPTYRCQSCGAMMWFNEKVGNCKSIMTPRFSMCCLNGKVQLPLMTPPLELFIKLFFDKTSAESKNFHLNVRSYNNMFSFTSMGGKIDHSMNRGGSPYTFVLSGLNYHKIGSLLPPEGAKPVYSQLYIYDTENEVSNRISAVSKHIKESTIDPHIVDKIKDVLDEVNPLVKQYRLASSMINVPQHSELKLCLISTRNQDGRNYNLPSASKVVALIVGDIDRNFSRRDVIVHELSGSPQRIDELHPSYLPLQYPILFPRGEDGYRDDVEHHAETLSRTKKKKMLSMREYFAYRLMSRENEISILLHAGKLFQQFIVDGYTMIESQRLLWVRTHQKELRADLYQGLTDALLSGERNASSVGKRVIVPSSFTGGARYMLGNYKDAMALCRYFGYPSIFITFTCNPAWPEITRYCEGNSLLSSNRPDILSRVFHMKLKALMSTIKKKKIFGRVCAEIPDEEQDPVLFELVEKFMLINVEKCNQSSAIKYLFKYISKGNDRVVASIYDTSQHHNGERSFDEIQQYYNFRYISACEAAWRIFAFEIHHRYPAVERLSFHLPNQQYVIYSTGDDVSELVDKPRVCESMFLAWMEINVHDVFAKTLTYSEFPHHYVYIRTKRAWKRREKGFAIGRITHTPPFSGELYYLRILITKVRGPTSYEDIRTVNGVLYPNFQAACYALGLLDDDNEYINGIKEASLWASGISISDTMKEQEALKEIELLFQQNGKSLIDFLSLPCPPKCVNLDVRNHLILQELNYDRDVLLDESSRLMNLLNMEQRNVFEVVMSSINSKTGAFFFVYGYGGTGKTFLWNALTSTIRARGDIVLTVASSGIAATLLPSGRTAHSRFAIPIQVNEDSVCNIKQNSPLANLIIATKLIIWDEAPMVQRFCIEAFDRTLKDIMHSNHPFGGKCVLMGGDFRQILPVIPRGTRADIVNACINSSYLWEYCTIFHLTKNMHEDGVEDLYTPDFLNTINCSGLPMHKLTLKVGMPVMLLRNIDQASGLCNGTRLRITHLGKSVVEAVTLNGSRPNEKVLIHRMDMNPSDSCLPFIMKRRQFPIAVSFAMTINKSQGQSLHFVGLYLPRPVFTHGQLYVALSRVKSIEGLKILLHDGERGRSRTTSNVVYREVFQNLVDYSDGVIL
ncbi:uncharacterized protein LOC114712429 [Neltuma alba]|uniref:uncharacterized protein LOC114712429 n=1 Tax=Neltuma alba TaxID=207710 RepID=UPI0010A50445|nr:uncharacterized protein LOC114712429 [Prosopis alba]